MPEPEYPPMAKPGLLGAIALVPVRPHPSSSLCPRCDPTGGRDDQARRGQACPQTCAGAFHPEWLHSRRSVEPEPHRALGGGPSSDPEAGGAADETKAQHSMEVGAQRQPNHPCQGRPSHHRLACPCWWAQHEGAWAAGVDCLVVAVVVRDEAHHLLRHQHCRDPRWSLTLRRFPLRDRKSTRLNSSH